MEEYYKHKLLSQTNMTDYKALYEAQLEENKKQKREHIKSLMKSNSIAKELYREMKYALGYGEFDEPDRKDMYETIKKLKEENKKVLKPGDLSRIFDEQSEPFKEEIKELHEEIKKLKEENKELLNSKNELWKEAEELTQKIETLKKENQDLQDTKSMYGNEIVELREEKEEIIEEYNKLKEDAKLTKEFWSCLMDCRDNPDNPSKGEIDEWCDAYNKSDEIRSHLYSECGIEEEEQPIEIQVVGWGFCTYKNKEELLKKVVLCKNDCWKMKGDKKVRDEEGNYCETEDEGWEEDLEW